MVELLEENKKLWCYVEELEKELDELASIYAADLTFISSQLKVEELRRKVTYEKWTDEQIISPGTNQRVCQCRVTALFEQES